MNEIGLRLRHIGLVPRLAKGPQPGDGPLSWHTRGRSFVERRALAAKLAHAGQVRSVSEATPSVVEGEVPHLTLDPGAVDRDGVLRRAQNRNHLRDRGVAELNPAELGKDRRFPRRVGQAGLRAPFGTGNGVKLAVAAIGKRAVAPDASSADALEETGEQVDLVRPRRLRLR